MVILSASSLKDSEKLHAKYLTPRMTIMQKKLQARSDGQQPYVRSSIRHRPAYSGGSERQSPPSTGGDSSQCSTAYSRKDGRHGPAPWKETGRMTVSSDEDAPTELERHAAAERNKPPHIALRIESSDDEADKRRGIRKPLQNTEDGRQNHDRLRAVAHSA